MPAAKTISGSVVPATRSTRRTGSESFGTKLPDQRRDNTEVPQSRGAQYHRHGERSEAIHPATQRKNGLLPFAHELRRTGRRFTPRNDDVSEIAVGNRRVHHGAQFAPHRISARRQYL